MKLYIAAHSQAEGQSARLLLIHAGHEITSRWLDETFKGTEEYTERERRKIATLDALDVERADALVLLSCGDRVPGGKFVEAGIALGQGKSVFVIGRRENMLLWHPRVLLFDTVTQFINSIK